MGIFIRKCISGEKLKKNALEVSRGYLLKKRYIYSERVKSPKKVTGVFVGMGYILVYLFDFSQNFVVFIESSFILAT